MMGMISLEAPRSACKKRDFFNSFSSWSRYFSIFFRVCDSHAKSFIIRRIPRSERAVISFGEICGQEYAHSVAAWTRLSVYEDLVRVSVLGILARLRTAFIFSPWTLDISLPMYTGMGNNINMTSKPTNALKYFDNESAVHRGKEKH